jgi:hypothetical protein
MSALDESGANEESAKERSEPGDIDIEFDPPSGPLSSPEHVYTPVLSTKAAEKRALHSVSESNRGYVAPLLQIKRRPRSGVKIGEDPAGKSIYAPPPSYSAHLASMCQHIRDCARDPMRLFGEFERVFIDVRDLQRQDLARNTMADVLAFLGSSADEYAPVVTLDDSTSHYDSVRDWPRRRGIGLRIRGNTQWPSLADLDAVLVKAGRTPAEVVLLLDASSVAKAHLATLMQPITAAIAAYASRGWRRMCLIAGAFPISIKDFPFGKTPVLRKDLALHQAVCRLLPAAQRPTFGDYASVHAVPMQGAPQSPVFPFIRYTDSKHWFVYRRREKSEVPAMCRQIVADYPLITGWKNAGDIWIVQRSRSERDSGDPEDWQFAGLSHHIWFVVKQMNGLG